jgi:deoxycytidylate deaminase
VGESLAILDAKTLARAIRDLFDGDPLFKGIEGVAVKQEGPVSSIGMSVAVRGLDPIEIDSIWPLSQEMKYGDFAGQEVRYKLITKPEVLHAESNALMKLLHSDNPVSTKGATLYVTLSPCFECSKLIVQAGINRVVYNEEYRIIDGLEFLKKFSNIEICQLEM